MPKEMNIRVVCRCRPLNKLEISMGGETCVDIIENTIAVKVKQAGKEASQNKFVFDDVIEPDTTQAEVFERAAMPLLERKRDFFEILDSMNGFNATIFAYGQTSSGKTYTMEGKNLNDPEQKGIIPRVMDRIFDMIADSDENIEFSLKVSMLEIYNEKIKDLLNPEKNNLKIKESKKKGIFVDDSTEVYVGGSDEMKKVMLLGAKNRSVASTRMNAVSSRSHSIFIMTIDQRDLTTGTSKDSRLYFIDLAGSEKVGKTNAKGQTLNEAKNINKSLTTLGMVINQLALGKKGGYIPYRDSKLTRLLQDSLGGNSMTTLLVACSMCSYNDKETLSTLRFGQRAKTIKNKPKENVERSAKELMGMLEVAEKKVNGYEELILMLRGFIDKNGVQIKEMPGYEKVVKFEKLREKKNKKNKKKSRKKKKEEEENLKKEIEKETETKDIQFEETNLLEEIQENKEIDINIKQKIEEEDSLLNLDIKFEGKIEPKTSDVSGIILSNSMIEDSNIVKVDKEKIEKLKIEILEKEQEITEFKQNMDLFEGELDELGTQNVLLMMKVETLHETSKKVINEYHSQLLKIHTLNQKQLLKFSQQESELEESYESLENLKNILANFSEETADVKMGALSTAINHIIFEAESGEFFDSTFDKNENFSNFFGKISNSLEKIYSGIQKNKLEVYDSFKIDLNLLNHQKYFDEFMKIITNEDLDSAHQFGNIFEKNPKHITYQKETEPEEEEDELLKIMLNSSNKDEKILELQKMVIAQKKKIKSLGEAKKEIEEELIDIRNGFNKRIENLKEGKEISNNELKSGYESKLEELEDENLKLKEELQTYNELKEENKMLEQEILNLVKIYKIICQQEEVSEMKDVHNQSMSQLQLQNNYPSEVLGTEFGEENTKRMERYRKERNRYMQKVKELKRSFVRKDQAYRDSLKNREALKEILNEQELEIESLREYIEQSNHQVNVHELINSKKVKTLRGGGGKKKKPKVSLFSLDFENPAIIQDEERIVPVKKKARFKETESDKKFNLAELKMIDTEDISKKSKKLFKKEDKSLKKIFSKKKLGEKVQKGKKGVMKVLKSFRGMFNKQQQE